MPDNRRVLPRVYAPGLSTTGEFLLPAAEAHHLVRVLRMSVGDEVAAFDGRGAEYRAMIVAAGRDRVTLRTEAALPVPIAPPVAVHVVQAVLKGSSMDDAVRDATMMGAAAIEPLLTDHVDVKAAVVTRPSTVERWRRIALSSVKQCRRTTLPEIHDPQTIDAWLAAPSTEVKLLFAEPSLAASPRSLKSALEHQVPPRIAVLLGPEGGWSGRELEAACRAGCQIVSLGPLTLRAESMAVAALAALAVMWDG